MGMKGISRVNRRRRLRVPRSNPKIQRVQDKVMKEARKIVESGRVYTLPKILYRGQMRVAEIEGIKVVLKNTHERKMHGYEYEELRRTFLQHQRALREGRRKVQQRLPLGKGEIIARNYTARTPKAYGRVGNYLVMQYVEGKSLARYPWGLEDEEEEAAYQEMKANFAKLKKDGLIKQQPQLFHTIIGNNGKQGKVVFYFVYDYG